MVEDNNQFSASYPALGYFHQCRLALSESIKKIISGGIFKVSVETLDDVVFENEGSPDEILQVKHRIKSEDTLTDYSTDLWKTIRIWSDLLESEPADFESLFYLITTQKIKSGSTLKKLKFSSKKEAENIVSELDIIASTSTNKKNLKAYEAYKALEVEQKKKLINSIIIVDESLSINEVDKQIKESLHFSTEEKFIESLTSRLEGWWNRQVVNQLQDKREGVSSIELNSKISELREQFKKENLPIDDDIMMAEIDESGYKDKPFVHQLDLIDVSDKRIFYAIRNYYRAFTQRSTWVREHLLHVGELEKYEERLIEDWEIKFEQVKDELGEEASEEEKKRLARKILEWVESGDLQKIRPDVSEPSIASGSYQMLSNQMRVGWHVEFKDKLSSLIGIDVAS
jgi:hypothetical protein